MRQWLKRVGKLALLPAICCFLIMGCASIPVSLGGRLCSSKSLLLKPEHEKSVVVSGTVLRYDISTTGDCESPFDVILQDEKNKLLGVPFGCAEQEFEPGPNAITAAIGKIVAVGSVREKGEIKTITGVASLGNEKRQYLPGLGKMGPVDIYFSETYALSPSSVYALCVSKDANISLKKLSIDYPTYRQQNPPKGTYTGGN